MAAIMYPRMRETFKWKAKQQQKMRTNEKKNLFYSTDKRQYIVEMEAWYWILNVERAEEKWLD